MENNINIFFVYDTNITIFNEYEFNIGYIKEKNKFDSEFIIYIINLLRRKINNFSFNIATQNSEILNFDITQNNYYDYFIKNNISDMILYNPINIKNLQRTNQVLNTFLNTNEKNFMLIESNLWNVESYSKNIILYYSEISEILYNTNLLEIVEKKKIDDFYTSSIAYIIKSYDSFHFIVLNKTIRYFSNPIKISNISSIEKEFNNMLAILFKNINEKMQNCEY